MAQAPAARDRTFGPAVTNADTIAESFDIQPESPNTYFSRKGHLPSAEGMRCRQIFVIIITKQTVTGVMIWIRLVRCLLMSFNGFSQK